MASISTISTSSIGKPNTIATARTIDRPTIRSTSPPPFLLTLAVDDEQSSISEREVDRSDFDKPKSDNSSPHNLNYDSSNSDSLSSSHCSYSQETIDASFYFDNQDIHLNKRSISERINPEPSTPPPKFSLRIPSTNESPISTFSSSDETIFSYQSSNDRSFEAGSTNTSSPSSPSALSKQSSNDDFKSPFGRFDLERKSPNAIPRRKAPPSCLQCHLSGLRCSFSCKLSTNCFRTPRSDTCCTRCERNGESFCIVRTPTVENEDYYLVLRGGGVGKKSNKGSEYLREWMYYAEGVNKDTVMETVEELMEREGRRDRWALPEASRWVRENLRRVGLRWEEKLEIEDGFWG